jgi:hypothetical protein
MNDGLLKLRQCQGRLKSPIEGQAVLADFG